MLLGASVAVVLFPWNPALWFISRRVHLALEIDCDARVLASGADPLRYGRLLLMVAQRATALPLAPTLTAPPSHLERRIAAMRTRVAGPRPLHLAVAGAALVLGLAGACSAGAPDAPSARQSATPATTPTPTVAPATMREFQVEEQARQVPGTGKLRYPDAMRQARREGKVLAQFVVDERGLVELSTFKVLESTDPQFTDAVRAALPTMRFYSSRVGGRAVKQLVQQPFTFALQKS
jgi:TonB family protein